MGFENQPCLLVIGWPVLMHHSFDLFVGSMILEAAFFSRKCMFTIIPPLGNKMQLCSIRDRLMKTSQVPGGSRVPL